MKKLYDIRIFLRGMDPQNLDLESNEILGNFLLEWMNIDTLVEKIIKNSSS